MILTKSLATLSAPFCAAVLAFSTNVCALVFNDSQYLGYVDPGLPTAQSLTYVNHLIGMGVGTDEFGVDGQVQYHRSINDFGPLTSAVLLDTFSGTGTSINLGAGGVYSYLFAKYDAGFDLAHVWDVDGLSVITIPAVSNAFGLSGWTVYASDADITAVPEPATLALLGLGLAGLGFSRRKQ